MHKPISRRADRPRNHYAALKIEAALVSDRATRDRYAETPQRQLIVQIPKPVLREATAARREVAVRQRRPIAPSPVLRPHGAMSSYHRARRYALTLQPV